MAEVELLQNFTEMLNLSGDCGTVLSAEAVQTINYYRYCQSQNMSSKQYVVLYFLLLSMDKFGTFSSWSIFW